MQCDGHTGRQDLHRASPGTANSRVQQIGRVGGRSGASDRERIPLREDGHTPTSSKGRSRRRFALIWVIATNPVVSFPNLGVCSRVGQSGFFSWCRIGFHPTPTTEVATSSFLPPSGERKKAHTQIRASRKKGQSRGEPPGEARTDFDIFWIWQKRLGCLRRAFPG